MKQIERWVEKGYIDESLAKVLELDIKEENEKKRKITTQIVLYTIGVILLGTGVVTFVASNNWILELLEKTPLLQILILLVLSILSLWTGWKIGYNKQNFPRLGGALVFLSTLLIGAAYIQMGQTYNWSTNASSVLALWFISIFPLAFIFKSKPVNWLSIIVFVITFPYFYYDWKYDTTEVWTIFMPFVLFGILYTFANIPFIQKKFCNFSISYKLTSLIPAFFTFLILIFSVEDSYRMLNIHYLAIPVILILINIWSYLADKGEDNLKKSETIFIISVMLFVIIMLVSANVNPVLIMILSHIFLISILSLGIYWGYKYENISLINLSNLFLLIYLLSVYCRYGWNYIDKTIFFLLGGIGLVSIGIFLEKGKKRLLADRKPEEE